MALKIKYCDFPSGIITPVSSKSISNRALIINALSNNKSNLINLSKSEDTNTLVELLAKLNSNEDSIELNVGPAGTVMRFLLTYCCLIEKNIILTGSERMKMRPLGNLINALRKLGANITCLEKEGFAPLQIDPSKIEGGKIELDSSISSQFVSSLLLCAPYFMNGLELKLIGHTVSSSYINLTIQTMKEFGVEVEYKKDILKVLPGIYTTREFPIEGDWSSASYFYSLAALSNKAKIELTGLNINSLQGDKMIKNICSDFGIETKKTNGGIIIEKKECVLPKKSMYDFILCPDIAQTVAPMLAGLKIEHSLLTGLNTLGLKETDRTKAIQTELLKFNCYTNLISSDKIEIHSANFLIYTGRIETYDDHRMAMGFAPLAQKTGELIIENEDTVKKSYIRYWDDLKTLGCIVENHDI